MTTTLDWITLSVGVFVLPKASRRSFIGLNQATSRVGAHRKVISGWRLRACEAVMYLVDQAPSFSMRLLFARSAGLGCSAFSAARRVLFRRNAWHVHGGLWEGAELFHELDLGP